VDADTSIEGLRELRASRTAPHVHEPRRPRRVRRPGSGAAPSFDTVADLVADLVSTAELIPRDRLAAARGRAGAGSLADALRDEGVGQADGIARSLARRHDLPYVDLQEERVSPTRPRSSRS
jgi:hypothetical protein